MLFIINRFSDLTRQRGGEMKKGIRRLVVMLCPLFCALFVCAGAADMLTPDSMTMTSPESSVINGSFPLSLSYPENETVTAAADTAQPKKALDAKLMMLGFFPVKEVSVELTDRKNVYAGGTPFGIRLYTDGLVVASAASFSTAQGICCPAEEAGITGGDVLLSVSGSPLRTNEQLLSAAENSGGKALRIEVKRGSDTFFAEPVPRLDTATGSYRLGVNVRDSIAGIGTMTYTEPVTGIFSGLGHGICDSSSGCLMPLLEGDIVDVDITSFTKSISGSPGSLAGSFSQEQSLGCLTDNSEHGVTGRLKETPSSGTLIPLAFKQEVTRGAATLLTTIDGSTPKEYSIEIEEISYNDSSTSKNMVVHITDKRLLDHTGGIVQGMSGSPIIQNGRLAGALTHVFVNDPSRGYAVFVQ